MHFFFSLASQSPFLFAIINCIAGFSPLLISFRAGSLSTPLFLSFSSNRKKKTFFRFSLSVVMREVVRFRMLDRETKKEEEEEENTPRR